MSAFSDKLQAWGDGLPEREQQLLGNLIGLAAASPRAEGEVDHDAEVAGFSVPGRTRVNQLGALSFAALSTTSSGSVTADWKVEPGEKV